MMCLESENSRAGCTSIRTHVSLVHGYLVSRVMAPRLVFTLCPPPPTLFCQLRIDRPVCVDAVPAPPPLLPPLSAPGPVWLRPFQRAINVLSELPHCPSPDGKRDVLLAAMGTAFRCVQVCV